MRSVTHGACDYLIKPVQMKELKNIWQHVIRKKKYECKEKDMEQFGSMEERDWQHKPTDDAEYSSSAYVGNWRSSRKREEDEDDGDDKDDSSTLKKRVIWSIELHQLFVTAVNQLGIDSMFLTTFSIASLVLCFFALIYLTKFIYMLTLHKKD